MLHAIILYYIIFTFIFLLSQNDYHANKTKKKGSFITIQTAFSFFTT